MNKQKIEACEKLCREFLNRVNALRNRAEAERLYYDALNRMEEKPPKKLSFEFLTMGSAESGALRRVSMELTRALANLRRPG